MTYPIFSKNFDIDNKRVSSIFQAIIEVCNKYNVPFFVVGAFARDIVMQHIHNVKPIRETQDIDFAIMIENWNEYHLIKSTLIEEYGFEQGGQIHQLIFSKGLYIDLIPFGKIEENNKISWPPHFNFMMNMIGYKEVYNSALPIVLDKKYPLQVASLEGIVLLKLIAWNDKKTHSKSKHIHDFMFIIDSFYLIYINKIIEVYGDLLDQPNFDDTLIAAEALGRNISLLSKDSFELKSTLLSILETALKNKDNSLLIRNMETVSMFDYFYCRQILQAFHKGIHYTSTN